jgi:hypothetical protein
LKHEKGYTSVELMGVALFIASFAAWITHVVVCLQAEKWGFLIAGAIFAPVGIIHGFGCWLGAW